MFTNSDNVSMPHRKDCLRFYRDQVCCDILALLDYVSRAHEIDHEIRPSSVRPSVVRPSVASIISEVIAWISFKFYLWRPLGHIARRFQK